METDESPTPEAFILLRDRFTAPTETGRAVRVDGTWGWRAERNLLIGFDFLVCLAFLLGVLVAPAEPIPDTVARLLPVVVVGYFLCAAWRGLNVAAVTVSALDDVPRLTSAVVIPALVVAPLAAGSLTEVRALAVAAASLCLLVVLGRATSGVFIRSLRARGVITHRTVLVGSGSVLAHLAETFRQSPPLGVVPVAVTGEPSDALPEIPHLPEGSAELLAEQVRSLGADRVVVAFGVSGLGRLVDAARQLVHDDCQFFAVPRMFEVSRPLRPGDHAEGIPLVRLTGAPRERGRTVKRLIDLAVAIVALVLLSPLLFLIALVTRVVDGPGVIFRQERVGRDGQPFVLLKFRSLRPLNENEASTRWSVDSEQRMGRWGRFLRRSSLDELPQLWNVVRGDMTLVGPRPERQHFVDLFSATVPHYRWRHRGTVGLTGLAQVRGLRGDSSIADRARADNEYLETRTLWTDVRLILLTLVTLVRPVRAPRRESEL